MYTLVLVGGTGQRFGLTVGLLGLLGACQLPRRVLVLDAEGAGRDLGNPITQAVDRLLRWGQPHISVERVPPYLEPPSGSPSTVAECVASYRSALFPLCMTEAEASLSVSRGFFANPKIASVVFRALLEAPGRLNTLLGDTGSQDPNEVVVIAGSLAGGTGAGILREVARTFRGRGSRRILGIVFTHYFDVQDGTIATRDLELNARLGCNYLMRPESLQAFDILALVGPPSGTPLPPPSGEGVGMPHPFPGFLAAASLVSDGGTAVSQAAESWRRPQPQQEPSPTYTILFGAAGSAFIEDSNLEFPLSIGSDPTDSAAPGDILRFAAQAAVEELQTLKQFRPTVSSARSSLFVERKLGASLVRSLQGLSEQQQIHTAHIERLERELIGPGRAVDVTIGFLNAFQRWLEAMGENGTLGLTRTSSSLVSRQSWRACISEQDREQDAAPHQRFAEKWCRQVAQGQWRGRRGTKPEGGMNRVLFPYMPPSAGSVPPPGRFSYVALRRDAIQLPGQIADRAFPTPLGAALAFDTQLRLGREDSLRVARALWVGMALGWLELDILDLTRTAIPFDQLTARIEARARFIGLLRVRSPSSVPSALQRFAGEIIGGTHPECGLWPGIRDEHRRACAALDEAMTETHLHVARSVMATWIRSIPNCPTPGMSDAASWTLVAGSLAEGSKDELDLDDIRTVGPCSLRLGSNAQAADRPLFLFAYEPQRAIRVDAYLATIGRGENPPAASPNLQVIRPELNVDTAATVAAGYLDWSGMGMPLRTEDESAVEAGLQSLALDRDVLTALTVPAANFRTAPSALAPDFIWARSRARRRFLHIPPEPLTVGVTDLSDFPQLPAIRGIYFHPVRREWIVWLHDPIYNSGSTVRRLANDPSAVQIADGWILKLPSNTLFLHVPDILLSRVLALSDQWVGLVYPALPIKREFIDLVVCKEGQQRGAAVGESVQFDCELVGGIGIRPVIRASNLDQEDRLHVEVWPDIRFRDWERFWTAVESDTPDDVASIVTAVFTRSDSGHYLFSRERRGAGYGSVLGRPRLIWIGNAATGGGFIAFDSEGERAESTGGRTFTLAVDFGTFRTALILATEGSSAAPRPIRPFAVSGKPIARQDQGNAKFWGEQQELLPRVRSHEVDDAPIAAEVLATAVVIPPDSPPPHERSIPFEDFGIPIREMQRMREFGGLKWRDDNVTVEVRRAYLRALLVFGAAEACSRGARTIKVRHSFPLAMNETQREALRSDFAAAVEWLRAEVLTGVSLLSQVGASESEAGMRAAEAAGGWILTLDLGGETLDLGLFETEGRERRALAWDSVRLGANLVADALRGREGWTESEVRWKVQGQLEPNDHLKSDVDRLQLLALEYAARFIGGMAAQLQPRGHRVDIVLLGSGWRWHRVLSESRDDQFHEESFQRRFVEFLRQRVVELTPTFDSVLGLNARVLHEGREKLAVALGLAALPADLPPSHGSVRAPNGLDEPDYGWTTVVGDATAMGPPTEILPQPDFPKVLRDRLGNGSISKRLPPTAARSAQGPACARLRNQTTDDGIRRRTALSVIYELLTKMWLPDTVRPS